MTENDVQPIISPEEEASDEEFRAAVEAAVAAASVPDDEEPAIAGDNLSAMDSLQGNEFAVEIDGELVKGVFRVSGLVTFRLNAATTAPTITLAKMVQRDASLPFNAWLRETINAGSSADRPSRTLAVIAVDDGEETRRWTLTEAYITEVHYSDFDTASSDFVEEIVTIAYSSLVEAWTWSEKQ